MTPAKPSTRKSRSTKSKGRSRGKGSTSRKTAAILTLVTAVGVVIAGVGLLKWSESRQGRAALLSMGSDRMFAEVQRAVDLALAPTLPGLLIGPMTVESEGTPSAADHDWSAPELGPEAAVHCRLVAVPSGESYWQLQQRIARAVAPAGARILWGERLYPGRAASDQLQANEEKDLLRLDLGVAGKPTHTLILHRKENRPRINWGETGQSAWQNLNAVGGPTVALLIDDWGNGRTAATDMLLQLPVPVTMAILPGLPFSRYFALKKTDLVLPTGHPAPAGAELAAEADGRGLRRAAGCFVEVSVGRPDSRLESRRREIMLHQPMEPQGYPETDPGPRAILVGMGEDAIAAKIDEAMLALPMVTGVNNHMGSAATSDPGTMQNLMRVLRDRGLYFIDSLTSSTSVALKTAREAGVPADQNRIFLDYDIDDHAKIEANLATLVASARNRGFAIGICHPHPATAEVLARRIPALVEQGVRFVTISEYLALRAHSAAAAPATDKREKG